VATEYGVANLKGRTVRERAQALIDIAHPDDRQRLMEEAKAKNILYHDQIYLPQCASLYPDLSSKHTFKGGIEIRFRHIKPSDEEEMRRLFYRFSDQSVYYRYFSPIKTMPHAKMQQYVNVDCNRAISIVALAGPSEEERIIAEARFVKDKVKPYGDVAFIVDEEYQGIGIATYLYQMLIRQGKERGLKGFMADVLGSNKSMMKVFEKGGLPVKATISEGVYELIIPFEE
jgi:GNAT superfamily N-acetyltransferase